MQEAFPQLVRDNPRVLLEAYEELLQLKEQSKVFLSFSFILNNIVGSFRTKQKFKI